MELLNFAMYLILASLFLLPIFSLIRGHKTRRKLPPGPRPLPVIGNLTELGDKPHKSMAELAKVYGPFLSLKLGQVTMIVISSPSIAKEILQKQDLAFSTRFLLNSISAHETHKHSVAWLPAGDKWRRLRKIMNLAIFSTDKLDSGQHLRSQKVHDLMTYATKCCRESVAIDIGQAVFTTSLNLLSNTIFSADLADLSQDASKEFRDLVWNVMVEVGKPNLADFFPIVAKFDPQGISCKAANLVGKMLKIFDKMIDEREELRRNGRIGDYDVLDVLLNLGEGTKEIDKQQIGRLLTDLFIAGTDTTSSTIEWAMTELLYNPESLKKVKTELEQTVGKCKPVAETDLAQLPYLQAIVKETIRKHPPAPLLVPRTSVTDIEVCGYTIPKGAQVAVNVWAMGRDPGLWVNPISFMPERFLNSRVDFLGRNFEFIPFGSGRRICPGLSMAIRVVPVVLGSLLNSFDWKLEDGSAQEDLDMEERFGITLQKAKPLRVIPFHQ